MDAAGPEARLEDLAVRAKAKDLTALTEIYDLLHPRVFRYVFAQLRHRQAAEDITHEVFLDVLESIERFTPAQPGAFVAWVFRIARNDVIDYRRRGRVRQHSPLEDADDLYDDGPDIGDAVVRTLQAERAWQLLRSLTEEQREVVLLRFGAELHTEEVAVVVGKSVGAVKVMQHRAVAALRLVLASEREEVA